MLHICEYLQVPLSQLEHNLLEAMAFTDAKAR